MTRQLLLLVAAVTAVGNAQAAHVVDLTGVPEARGYEVAFCPRPAASGATVTRGPAFVSFSDVLADGTRSFLAIGGNAPAVDAGSPAWSILGARPSARSVVDERYASALQECLRVKVSESAFARARSRADRPLKALEIVVPKAAPVTQAYGLGPDDCIGLVTEVAGSLAPEGLKVPARKAQDTPVTYIERLKAANSPSLKPKAPTGLTVE